MEAAILKSPFNKFHHSLCGNENCSNSGNTEVMSKTSKSNNNPPGSAKTPKSGNPLENYFGSPVESAKKRKKSSSDLTGISPPTKKIDTDENTPPMEKKENANPTSSTPTSDKVCKHLDSQLSDMEKRLETSLTANLSASITASVTAGLKGLIDSSLKEALETMSNRVNEIIDEHPTVVQHGEQLDSLETENLILKSKVSKMEGEATNLKKRLETIESRALENNLIIRGVEEDEWEKESTTRSKIYSELIPLITCESKNPKKQLLEAKKLEIRNCKRLGRYTKDRARPISAEFVRKEDVEYILSNKTNLNNGVFMEKEYPADVEKKRKLLRPILKAAKHSKKYKKQCRMENDILVIKSKRYNVNELDKLPKSLKPANVTSKTNKTVFGYFGELNPLSNFYPSSFKYQDTSYHCSEQFIQLKKAELFKDKAAMKRIIQTKTGHQCKTEGQRVTKFNQETWEANAYQLCMPGIRQKFLENDIPRQLLLTKTKGKRITECTKDPVWGCGMSINNENCLDITKWTSQGLMGSILEEIRNELAGPETSPLPALPDYQNTRRVEGDLQDADRQSTATKTAPVHSSNNPVAMKTNNDSTSSSSSEESSDSD